MGTVWRLDPLLPLLLCFLVVLVIAFFWPGQADRQDGTVRHRPPDAGQGPASPDRLPDFPDGRFPGTWGGGEPAAVRELAAVCSAEYAARFAAAIRRVRVF
jgi:hypothetical protein